jgi:hypothetical protein
MITLLPDATVVYLVQFVAILSRGLVQCPALGR